MKNSLARTINVILTSNLIIIIERHYVNFSSERAIDAVTDLVMQLIMFFASPMASISRFVTPFEAPLYILSKMDI